MTFAFIVVGCMFGIIILLLLYGIIFVRLDNYYSPRYPKKLRIIQEKEDRFRVERKDSFLLGWRRISIFNIGFNEFSFEEYYSTAEEANKEILRFIEFYERNKSQNKLIKEFDLRNYGNNN